MKKLLLILVLTLFGFYNLFSQGLQDRDYSHYFLTESAMKLKAGDVFYQNGSLIFNQVSVGVTDNFSVNTGAMPILFLRNNIVPVWISTKVAWQVKEYLHFGAGTLLGNIQAALA